MQKTEGVRKLWNRYKFVGLIVLIGMGLLLWPSGNGTGTAVNRESAVQSRDLETEMAEILSAMSGVAIPKNLSGLQGKEEKHTGVIEKDAMLEYVLNL